MRDTAVWAFWRRLWYGLGFGLFWVGVFVIIYFAYLYEPASCFDGKMNGDERGIDCSGSCVRICASDVIPPNIRWSQSFKVRDGQYNAVAYVENLNEEAATPELPYTFSLYDNDGLITEASGTTVLPPDSVYPVFAGPLFTDGRVPTQTFIELGQADEWRPAEFGSRQFTVSNRDLVSVDFQPRLNAVIMNNSLTPLRDVEVVATIFDARGNALNASRTFVEELRAQTQEDIVFTWPEPIAKTLRSCDVPTDVVVAIDLSGSMNNDQADPPEPVSSVLEAAERFVGRLRSKDQAAVITFATDAVVVNTLTNDIDEIANTISNLVIDPEEETGSTNTGDAFARALEELDSARHNNEARRVVVILTDGLTTAPDNDPEEYAKEKAAALKESGAEVYAIGLGDEVNMEFVREVATDREYAFQALSRSQIDDIYRNITGDICEDGPAVIDVIPKVGLKSPF